MSAIAASYRPVVWTERKLATDRLANKTAQIAFRVASHLTDPICKSHELYRRLCVANTLHFSLARKVSLCAALVICASAAVVTTLPGIALRALGQHLQTKPFIYMQGPSEEKHLPPNGCFSLLSWNICCVGAGYSISDGGVDPWASRIDAILQKIVETNADVNCLYETFDVKSAFYLTEKLKQHGYTHFYFNIGPKAVGVSSGMFVASKYNIQNPEFTRFPLDSLVGRTKNAAKGIFSFDLESQGEQFARIHSTHLQHSEEPAFPTEEEIAARKKQMEIVVNKVNAVRDRCIVVTGDLNLDDAEYKASSWQHLFQKDSPEERSWGGDAFCARLVGKQISGPLNLDYTMIANGTARAVHTTLVRTGYDPEIFKAEALSDHEGLLSQITIC